uniref:Sulfhydryl oxidase n=2 Tax=Takifugu TaxID=31032 RepID=A0A674MEA2_TAKRU
WTISFGSLRAMCFPPVPRCPAGVFRLWLKAAVVLWLAHGCVRVAGSLYTKEDPLVILSSGSLKSSVTNSSSAWLLQFFSSWCGHCVQYSSTWKILAEDVKDWQTVIVVSVLDCAQEENYDICREFGVQLYPTIKYFHAHSPESDRGTIFRGADRQVQVMRHLMVDILQNHTKLERPDHCPPLETYRYSEDLLPLLGQRSEYYTAIIVEEPESYIGREVILDLLMFSGVEVKRALSSDRLLMDALKITTFPSLYLLHPNSTHTELHIEKKQRFFFSSLLKMLPGVQRKPRGFGRTSATGLLEALSGKATSVSWRTFNSVKVYTADLESALHYLLRVELATHDYLEGEELNIFKDFVTVVAKLYPVGGSVVKLMKTLSNWLSSIPLQRLSYQKVLDLVDNKMRIAGMFLGAELRWVGCQGSRAGLRGYPCSLWTLFHILTVQHDAMPTALENTGLEEEAAPVLQVMRRYMRTFFGCGECGRHFEQAAASSMDQVENKEDQILWLWDQHNRVNARLAGTLSDDPQFPKALWPGPTLCASCHEEKNGVHIWNRNKVLVFLRQHYGASNLSPKYSIRPPEPPSEPAQFHPFQKEHQEDNKELNLKFKEHPESQARHQIIKQDAGGPEGGVWVLGLGFNSIDMSLCVVLYVCSCLVLMFLFFFFKVKSKRWKHRQSHLQV